MAWTAPRTWVTGETVTAALMNAHVRDNLLETSAATVTTAGDIAYADGANSMGNRLAIFTPPAHMVSTASGPVWRGIGVNSVDTTETTASTSFTDLATSGPSTTVTTGTSAIILVQCGVLNDTAGALCYAGFAVSGASTVAANDDDCIKYESGGAGDRFQAAGVFYLTSLTGGSNTFRLKYHVNAGTGTFEHRRIIVIPIN